MYLCRIMQGLYIYMAVGTLDKQCLEFSFRCTQSLSQFTVYTEQQCLHAPFITLQHVSAAYAGHHHVQVLQTHKHMLRWRHSLYS
jgi:hypothetical protein